MNCIYRMAVLNALKELKQELSFLLECIRLSDSKLPAWLEPVPYPALRHENARESSCRLYQQMSYLPDQEGREIVIGVGLLGASPETLKQAEKLNLAKKDFQAAVKNLKAQKLRFTDNWLREAFLGLFETLRHEFTATALEAAGLSRLHLKQCYRQIPVLKQTPIKVSWTWANTRSIKKISKSQAVALLKEKGNDFGILQQIDKVEGLAAGESIAIVQELAPHLRTNIIYPGTGEEVDRIMMKGSLPLLYPAQEGEALPIVIPPKATQTRQTRSDLKIDPEIYLPAIRGHRYA